MTIKKHPMYINGEFVHSGDGAGIDVVNPATGTVISQIADASITTVRQAIDAAEQAQPAWEALAAVERGQWLHRIAAGIRHQEKAITQLIVEE